LYFWTHNTAIAPSGSDYVYTADDYATYNITGGTAGGPLPIPVSGPALSPGLNTSAPDGFIAAGQSFFVENAAPGSFQFTNAMRVSGNNSQFFKQVTNTKKTNTIEKNRIWLNLTNSGGAFKQLLVGYITGATNDWDNLYDGPTFDGQEFVDFYSLNQGKNLTIQGRALPFEDTDIVPLGYRSTIAGTFNISIDNRDGALAGQAIWLEDKKTNTMHDLTKGKYTFIAIDGVENDRFVLKYTNKTLGTDDNELTDKALIVSVKNKKITVTSSAEAITQVQVFDLLGRKVYDKSKINTQEWTISNLSLNEQALIVKTTLANGAISNKKIIY
ncbi:T9SS sorting signal type C domain-containing protein, partial [Flavobacterium succinicans]|uniref:T9SS sorting signal type C domain-containing protein n=1 Tax=Flavobacterium succinicans TaxID=29536 RepID=UPI0012FC7182